jgi:MFS family permease
VKSNPHRDLVLIKAAGFLRSLAVGLIGVVLGIYLFRVGLSSVTIGFVIAAGLAGSALATIIVTFAADHLGRRPSLLVLSLLSAIGGLAFALSPALPILLMMVFVGMLNGTGTDRSAALALDLAIVPGLAPDSKRTWNLAWYNVLLDGGGSLGALAAGLPLFLQHGLSFSLLSSYRVVFFGYSGLCLIVAALYAVLSPAVEVNNPPAPAKTKAGIIPPETKRVLARSRLYFRWMLLVEAF